MTAEPDLVWLNGRLVPPDYADYIHAITASGPEPSPETLHRIAQLVAPDPAAARRTA